MSQSLSTGGPRQILKQVWGYDHFLPQQREAIEGTLAGRDSLVVLPTGGGKSVCYQIPPLVRQDFTVVVSPLVALMKDQVDALKTLGLEAGALNSSVPAGEQQLTLQKMSAGKLRLLYVTPERLLAETTLSLLKEHQPGSFAIDEAHCISSWGHDFRPEYRRLAMLKELFSEVPVSALTATASPEVRADIIVQLGLREPQVLIGSFHRPNLHYWVQRCQSGYNQVCNVMERYRGQSGIIYAIRRQQVEEISDLLNRLGFKTLPYHAGLPEQTKKQNQESFQQDEIDAIVATIAFGMGIDKSNVRYVIHYGMPRSIEHYQQESGRAGRDGLPAECWLLHSGSDRQIWERMIDQEDAERQACSRSALQAVVQFCHSHVCRHRFLVEHFGQDFDAVCQSCDVCSQHQTLVDNSLKISQVILSCVHRCNQRFGADHISKVLVGSLEKKVVQFKHHQLSTWGLLKEYPKAQLRDWIEQLLAQGFLVQEGEFPVLTITTTGRELLRSERAPVLTRTVDANQGSTPTRIFDSWEGVDRELFEQLRKERRRLADLHKVSAFIIFSDATLRDLARRRPTRIDTLQMVHGIGQQKAKQYGETIMRQIADWCREKNLACDIEIQPISATGSASEKATVNTNAAAAFPFFDRDLPIQDIAEKLSRAPSTVYNYLQIYIQQNKITDATRWVDKVHVDKILIAADYLDDDRLKPLFEAFHGTISYDCLRIVMACWKNKSIRNSADAR